MIGLQRLDNLAALAISALLHMFCVQRQGYPVKDLRPGKMSFGISYLSIVLINTGVPLLLFPK